jgi:NAD(P)-dependent dehydrogenase (short-subunit alcohol dehydrogenase family)
MLVLKIIQRRAGRAHDCSPLTTDVYLPGRAGATRKRMAMRSVLITGTSKGIGFETALAFAHAGYRVHATMRNPSNSPTLSEIAAQEKLPITVTTMDVTSDESVQSGIAAIQAHHGPVDVLVNNAGIELFGSIEEQSIEDFRSVMETN